MAEASAEHLAITLEDFLAMGEDARVEIMDGVYVEKPMVGGLHHIIVMNYLYALETYVRIHPIGTVFPDGMTFLIHSDKRRLRDSFEPDVSFIRNEHIPADWDIKKPFPGVPDFAVEVVSPDDSAAKVQKKVRTYLDKGTDLVLVTYPDPQEIHAFHRQPETVRIYRGSQKLELDAMFPGLELTTDMVFNRPAWAQKKDEDEGA